MVFNVDQVQEVKDVGSQFIIIFIFSEKLFGYLSDVQLLFLFGIVMLFDILLVVEVGLIEVKFFLVILCGGVGMLKNFGVIFL